jgi:hypothetical protein
VKTPAEGIQQQFAFSLQVYQGMQQSFETIEGIKKLRAQIKVLRDRGGNPTLSESLASLDQKAAAIEGEGRADAGSPGIPGSAIDARDGNLTRVNTSLTSLLELLQSADVAPTTQATAALGQLQQQLANLLARWSELKEKDVKSVNEELSRANLSGLTP